MQEGKNIYQRINAVMHEIDYIAKGEKFVNGQYRFVSHDAVTAKLHPLLAKHGIVVIPTTGEMKQEGNRTQVKLDVHFVNMDNPQDLFCVTSYGFGIDGGDKGPGKAVSYAFKYAMLKTFCLETGDDPDNDANASYEPLKCVEFDALIEPTTEDKKKLKKFLEHCAQASNTNVEDVKRQAMQHVAKFLEAFEKWKP